MKTQHGVATVATRKQPDILERLIPLTKQGEDYIWRPALDAGAEIERLREVNANLLDLARLFERTVQFLIDEDRRTGDDEGANCKSITLHTLIKPAIAKAEGRP